MFVVDILVLRSNFDNVSNNHNDIRYKKINVQNQNQSNYIKFKGFV